MKPGCYGEGFIVVLWITEGCVPVRCAFDEARLLWGGLHRGSVDHGGVRTGALRLR